MDPTSNSAHNPPTGQNTSNLSTEFPPPPNSAPNSPIILDLEDDDTPIPSGLRFMLESLKILTADPLTHENFLTWNSQIQTIFKANGYTKYLHPNLPIPPQIIQTAGQLTINPAYKRWNLINCHLVAALVATISPSLKPFVLNQTTIAGVWNCLSNRLQSQTISRAIQLRDELTTLNLKGETITTYISMAKTIVDKMAAAGMHLSDQEISYYMMKGLPPLYNQFSTASRMKTENTNLESFYSLLPSCL